MRTFSSILTVLGAVCLLVVAPAHGEMLGYYRLGDIDPSPVDGADIVSTLDSSASGYGSLAPDGSSDNPQYSTTVPGVLIYDPLSDTTVSNGWSLNGGGDGPRERVRTIEKKDLPSAFSFEVFANFGEQSTSSSYGIFGNHSKSTYGGWIMRRMDDGTIRVELDGPDSVSGLAIQSTVTVPADESEWHHFGLIFEGNSTDGSIDTHLYIDYEEVASGNYDDSMTFGGSSTPAYFYAGEWYRNGILWVDEERYFNNALALDGSEFLRAVPEPSTLVLTVLGLLGACIARKR